jgi:hypothetical protein
MYIYPIRTNGIGSGRSEVIRGSLVDQRLRVWRSVASFFLTLEGYVNKCCSNRQDLHTRLALQAFCGRL